jgi:hypothetical protein
LSPERCVVLYCQSTALGNIHSAVDCRKIFCLVRRSASAHTDAFDQGWQARAQHLLVSHAAAFASTGSCPGPPPIWATDWRRNNRSTGLRNCSSSTINRLIHF